VAAKNTTSAAVGPFLPGLLDEDAARGLACGEEEAAMRVS
jgi:hypothetical protein